MWGRRRGRRAGRMPAFPSVWAGATGARHAPEHVPLHTPVSARTTPRVVQGGYLRVDRKKCRGGWEECFTSLKNPWSDRRTCRTSYPMISPSPSSMASISSADTRSSRRPMRSMDSVRIWLILTQDRFGSFPVVSSSVSGNWARGSWLVRATARRYRSVR